MLLLNVCGRFLLIFFFFLGKENSVLSFYCMYNDVVFCEKELYRFTSDEIVNP